MTLRAAALGLMVLTAVPAAALPRTAAAQVFVSWRVNVAPPPLPVYVQPPLPDPDYVWTPGYWAWNDDVDDYYWVPGVWVLAPRPGLLWTPGWWGWDSGVYAWHGGYWGPHVGWYGGVNYGFGYTGLGFAGGYWSGPHFFYNRSVVNVTNVNITNVYNKTVVNETTVNRVSFNGPGGVTTRPTPAQLAAVPPAARVAPTPDQERHLQAAQALPTLRASANHGAPPIAATPMASQFRGPGIVRAQGAPQVGGLQRAPQARGAPGGYGRAPQPGYGQQGYDQRTPTDRVAPPSYAAERNPQATARYAGGRPPAAGGDDREDAPPRGGGQRGPGYGEPRAPQAAYRPPPAAHAPAYHAPPPRPAPHPQEAKRPPAPHEGGRKEER